MGCDWSKSAASFEDLHDAPYSLLSVSVEEGGRAQLKAGKRGSKKRDKRKARDGRAAKGQDDSAPVVPKSSSSISDGDTRGAHKSMMPSLNLPGRPEGANRRGEELDEKAKKGINVGAIASGGAKPALGLKLDLSKAISQGREPTERQLRKEKLDRYENECTKVEEFMYVGGIRVAQNIQLLKAVGITHVINCSAITTENFFPETFAYKALYMNDSPGEDLACHIYSVVAVIDEVRRKGQKVLVHCTQGVSRSCSFCIAYLMLLERISYEDGFQRLKARRGICNPNPGFCSQLVLWGRRVLESKACGQLTYPPRIFRVDYYYPANKKAGVAPMLVDRKDGNAKAKQPYALQSVASYIIDSPECVFVWTGARSSKGHGTVADFTVQSLQTYEGSPTQTERCEEGKESERMLAMLQELQCLLPSQCGEQQLAETDARPPQQLALLADDSAYLADRAQRRAEEREREERDADARRVEEQVRAVREQEAEDVRRRVAQEQEHEAARPALAVSAHNSADAHSGADGAGGVKRAFPQGGLAEEVQTPRGRRSDAPALAGPKLAVAASGGGAISPIPEKSGKALDKESSSAGGASPNGDSSNTDFKMRLFEVPDDMGEAWEEIENFDSDDLWSTKAFVLVERATTADDAVPVLVWIGADYEGVADPDDEEECHNLATKAVSAFAKCEGITVEEVKVVLEGNEPDAFWDMFELG